MDYETLDAGKRAALGAALSTSRFLLASGGQAHDGSRGEPAFVFTIGETTLALVMEGLGTKSIVAREVQERHREDHFRAVAYDAVAAILNDLICVGALPLVVNAYFATGSSRWYEHDNRYQSLLDGWQEACEDAECVWGGGESPSLPSLVGADDIELAGAAVGTVPADIAPVLGQDLAPGDEIVLIASSGMHANGASLARAVAARSPRGWATPLSDGRHLGAAVMTPSILYVALIRRLIDRGVGLHYLSHITGHGLQKLMRPQRDLSYRIARLPDVPAELSYIAEASDMSAREAYSTLNMGCGFAVYTAPGDGAKVVRHADELGLRATVAGTVEEGPRQVVLEPLDVVFSEDELSLTAS
ncbi:MAG: AIR synthase related protein [Solirubrobacteraceae bacterium]